jgi:hypothetical protein
MKTYRPQRKIAVKRARRRIVVLGALTLAGLAGANAAVGQSPEPWCDVRLAVELTPDVPNPLDVGFLGSLLSDHVSYELSLRRERSDTAIVVELTGPGPDYRCQNVIETIRRDGRVLSVRVIGETS